MSLLLLLFNIILEIQAEKNKRYKDEKKTLFRDYKTVHEEKEESTKLTKEFIKVTRYKGQYFKNQLYFYI